MFEDMIKQIRDYPQLSDILRRILFEGESISFNAYDDALNLANMFDYIKCENGRVAVSNRIFEVVLYDYFLSEDKTDNAASRDAETMNYEEAMCFLKDTEKYGSRPGLDSIRHLMREFGDIQEKIPIVHIAGTNGKGSAGAMLSSVLAASGYRVGRFNTPDVFSYEEEFLMNGVPIERERLARLFTEVSAVCARMTKNGLPHPTRFEVETAAAFLWFYEEQCDIALVEVGMGGETDATNLITKPLVSVLTSISMDHMKFLGDTLPEIAAAKAGIIKRGCPVVSAEQKPEVWKVIREKCRREGARLILADEKSAVNPVCMEGEISFLWDMTVFGVDGENETVSAGRTASEVENMFPGHISSYGGNTPGDQQAAEDMFPGHISSYGRITPGLRGRFQMENAVCALRVLEVLKEQYPRISRSAVISGLRGAHWPGRFEQIASSPDIYLDGAHNEGAAAALRATLDLYCSGKRIIYIMGVLADKAYEKMIRIMFRGGDRVYTLTPPNPRALSAEELAIRLKGQKADAVPCANPGAAVSYALAEAKDEDVILAFGSLFCLNEIREAFRKYS
ncbi:MAG: bifunctional folylpolyglutamate synthase/dihydrofolate synthase [Lachnospiraceae bacterium]|nr:bifunctional folylpolyglutamate synthase/dihydrofolate synthase [Lachnospiraceae bacterium]